MTLHFGRRAANPHQLKRNAVAFAIGEQNFQHFRRLVDR
jgi:hypothetical protein